MRHKRIPDDEVKYFYEIISTLQANKDRVGWRNYSEIITVTIVLQRRTGTALPV